MKINNRDVEHDIEKIFPNRWSPRAMSGEKINDKELMKLFEAARWAPSSSNIQPWRFVYARRDSKEWDKFFNALMEFNQQWCKNAAVLILAVSKQKNEEGKDLTTSSFDTGAACENLALQGSMMGLVIHGMAGFDYKKAREALDIPEDYKIEAMIAVGKKGNKNDLPEFLKEREVLSGRNKVESFIFEGKFRL